MTREINLGNLVIPIIKPQKGIDYYTEAEKQELISTITNSVNAVILPQEQTRQSNEATRQSNEATRQSNEASRVANETSRGTAESSRAEAETTRQSNETSRETAEGIREETFTTQMEAVDVAIAGINTSQESFNQNATSKTNDFNTNAINKTTAFDENATSKTTAFDEHVEEIQIAVAENTQDISDIKTEQTTQNTNISSNTSRIVVLESNSGNKIALSINSNYVMTLQLLNKNNEVLSEGTIDLPIESMVVNASYSNGVLTLTLQNGQTLTVDISSIISGLQQEITSNNKLSSDLVDDTNHTNKFTTQAEKEKLSGIASGAQVNVLEAIKVNGTSQTISNKTVDITVPTKISDLTNDSDFEDSDNKTQTINESSTTTEYPSAKAVYDEVNPIKEETEALQNIINQMPTVDGNGNYIALENTIKVPCIIKNLKGNTTQENYSGANLYNVDDVRSSGTGVTVDDEDFITITYDNSSGSTDKYLSYYTNNLDVNENTNYLAVAEIEKVSGDGGILAVVSSDDAVGAQFATDDKYNITSLSAGDIKTATVTSKADFTSTTVGLRTYLFVPQGKKASVTFRISLLADTTVTPSNFSYEPYVGEKASPNSDYPQEIKVVTGENNIFISNKNLLKITSTTASTRIINAGFPVPINKGQTIYFKANYTYTQDDRIQVFITDKKNQNPEHADDVEYYKHRQKVSATSGVQKSLTAEFDGWVFIRTVSAYPKYTLNNIMLSWESINNYVDNEGEKYPLDLGNIELCKIGTFQDYIFKNKAGSKYYNPELETDKWYIHKENDIEVYDGTESGWVKSQSVANADRFIINTDKYKNNSYSLCNYLIKTVGVTTDIGTWFNNANVQLGFNFSEPGETTLEQWKEWLNAHNLIVLQPLVTPVDIEITSIPLIIQLEAIEKATSYSGTTNIWTITTETNLDPIVDAKSLLDLNSLIRRIEILESEV